MKSISRLTELCAAFRCSDAQLTASMLWNDATGQHARLLRRTTELLQRIERYEPASTEEVEELVDFYARRRIEAPGAGVGDLDRLAKALAAHRAKGLPQSAESGIRPTPAPSRLPDGLEGHDLAAIVVRADERMTAVTRCCRILAASQPELAARKVTAGHAGGRHIFEVIGCGGRQFVEQRRIELAFKGQPQSYDYTVTSAEGPVRYRKRMDGVADKSGQCYAVVVRTGGIEAAGGIKRAAPGQGDHRSAGTT